MSYVLGWKTRSNVYLAADSMLTTTPVPISERSSFGERQIRDNKRSIAERAMKIVVEDDLAIGLCGDFRLAHEMASSVFRSYGRYSDPDTALREMIVSHGPYPMRDLAQLVVACKGKAGPRLFSFNHDSRGSLSELSEGEGRLLGSIPKMFKGMTHKLFKHLFAAERLSSGVYLTAALGVLQSFGLRDYLLEDGAGGCFTGLRVTGNTIIWQPDLFYFIEKPGEDIWTGVATCVRDGTLIVTSSSERETRIFATMLDSDDNGNKWFEKWGEFAARYMKDRSFDYVILLGLTQWVIVVIEMRRFSESKWIAFAADSGTKDGVARVQLNRKVADALRRSFEGKTAPDERRFRFGFLPYESVAQLSRES